MDNKKLIEQFPQVFYKEEDLVKYEYIVEPDGLVIKPVEVDSEEEE